MATVKADNVWEVGHGSGIGAITVGDGVPDGYRTFGSQMADGDDCTIYILDLTSFRWERCKAFYDADTNTLTRDTFKASSTGGRVDFAAGPKWVTMTPAASDIVYQGDFDDAVDIGLALHTLAAAGLATGGGTLDSNPTISVLAASQAEAEAGSSNTVAMTPLRVAQEIAALIGPVSWRTLATLTPSGVASVTDTTHFSSTYKVYEIELINVIPVSNADTLALRLTQGGVSQTAGNYFFAINFVGSNSATPGGSVWEAATYVPLATPISAAGGNNGVSGWIRIYDPANATGKKAIKFELTFFSYGAPDPHRFTYDGSAHFDLNNTAIDGFVLYFLGSNIASGTIKIKGGL